MAILSMWLAGVMIVAKGKFAISVMFRLKKGLLARYMNQEDIKNLNPPHFQREFNQFVHYKVLAQCDAQHLQKQFLPTYIKPTIS